MTEALNWPPNWALTLALGLLTAWGVWFVSVRGIRDRNRSLERLRDTLHAGGVVFSEGAFAVTGPEVGLVISGDRLAVLDLIEPKVVGLYSVAQIEGLAIHDDKEPNAIDFHLEFKGGSRSRRVRTTSNPEFCRLFDFLQRAESPVRFIAE